MKKLGIKESQRVDLITSTGEMIGVRVSPFEVRPGNIVVYYPDENTIIPANIDPRSKTPSLRKYMYRISIAKT